MSMLRLLKLWNKKKHTTRDRRQVRYGRTGNCEAVGCSSRRPRPPLPTSKKKTLDEDNSIASSVGPCRCGEGCRKIQRMPLMHPAGLPCHLRRQDQVPATQRFRSIPCQKWRRNFQSRRHRHGVS